MISLPKHHTSLAHLEHSMVKLMVTEGSMNESKLIEGSSLASCLHPLSGSLMLVMDGVLAVTNPCTDEAAQCTWALSGCVLFNQMIL